MPVAPFMLWPGVYRVGRGVSAPRLISSQRPEYSDEARLAGIEGEILVHVEVGEDGVPRVHSVTDRLGYGLAAKAIECVHRWRFSPGTLNGKPVPVAATVQVSFRLQPLQIGSG